MVDDILKKLPLGVGQEALDINPFLGSSEAIRRLAQAATRPATGDRHVVVVGELGTGKADLARWLYRNSSNRREPLIEFNCVRFRRSDAELDGHLGEIAQGLVTSIPGRGTVLIQHVERMDSNTQARFLRAVGFGSSVAGEADSGDVNLRLLMTREQGPNAGNGRIDLARRLSSLSLLIPPLRQRPEDLPVIAFHLLQQLSRELGTGDFDLARGAIRLLQSYSWPGNIRELRSVLQRAVLVAKTRLLAASDLVFNAHAPELVPTTAPLTLKEMERQHIERVLNEVGGRVQVAAKLLGLPRSSLYHKLKQYKNERLALPAAS